jgi:hypothetical protein
VKDGDKVRSIFGFFLMEGNIPLKIVTRRNNYNNQLQKRKQNHFNSSTTDKHHLKNGQAFPLGADLRSFKRSYCRIHSEQHLRFFSV